MSSGTPRVLEGREWNRLRIGVGAAGESAELREHVLEEVSAEEAGAVDALIGRAAEAVECWCLEGLMQAMNRFNRSEEEEVSES